MTARILGGRFKSVKRGFKRCCAVRSGRTAEKGVSGGVSGGCGGVFGEFRASFGLKVLLREAVSGLPRLCGGLEHLVRGAAPLGAKLEAHPHPFREEAPPEPPVELLPDLHRVAPHDVAPHILLRVPGERLNPHDGGSENASRPPSMYGRFRNN